MKNLCTFAFFLFCLNSSAQVVGDGSAGAFSVTSYTYADNNRAAVSAVNLAPTTYDEFEITDVTNGGGWTVGKRVLIMLMSQGSTPVPNRNFRIGILTNVSLGTSPKFIRIQKLSGAGYVDWCTTPGSNCKIQVIVYEQYSSVSIGSGGTLTCNPWDGSTGGVVTFGVSGTLSITSGGKIDVKEKGFGNQNPSGSGGIGGIAYTQGDNPAIAPDYFPFDGYSGVNGGTPYRPHGQCISVGTPGGHGGTGGYPIPGLPGTSSSGDSRLSLLKNVAEKPALGTGGNQGQGGQGGAAGGSGGNGGNSASPGTSGTIGTDGVQGGSGGDGGVGGGAIIVCASTVSLPTSTACFDISGGVGGNGVNATYDPTAGMPGSGGNGGDAACVGFTFYGFGGFGAKGLRGGGASGGSGGQGGSVGSVSLFYNSGTYTKATHLTKTPGNGGAGGTGAAGCPSSTATNGINGYAVPFVDHPNHYCNGEGCFEPTYNVYACACNEAYKMMSRMNLATQTADYITYRNNSSTIENVVNESLYTSNSDLSVCYYFPHSGMLFCMEPASEQYDKMALTRGSVSVKVGETRLMNIYWCKTEGGEDCHTAHGQFAGNVDMIHSPTPSYVPHEAFVAHGTTATQTKNGLLYHYGSVDFDQTISGATPTTNRDFNYSDITPASETGVLTDYINTITCAKTCPTEFDFRWIYTSEIAAPDGGVGHGNQGGTGDGHTGPYIPFIPELWDVPPPDGQPGTGGTSGDDEDGGGSAGVPTPDPDEPVGPPNGGGKRNGLSTNEQANLFALSPNPASNELFIGFKHAIAANSVTLIITDVTGKTITLKQPPIHNNKGLQLNISQLNAGTYFVQLNYHNQTQVLKFTKN